MAFRIFVIAFIYAGVSIGWMILGGTVALRTDEQDSKLRYSVGQLWGTAQHQSAPSMYYETEKEWREKKIVENKTVTEIHTRTIKHSVPLASSEITADVSLDHRKKGLLWYSTYRVDFRGVYRVLNSTNEPQDFFLNFRFPNQGAVYDNFVLEINGETVEDIEVSDGVVKEKVRVGAGKTGEIVIAYASQGLDDWWYQFGEEVSQIKNFSLTINTDFPDVDFPENGISPTEKEQTGEGWRLSWKYSNLLSGVQIGLSLPQKLNPGPWVSQITFFAPVSLFFFFFVMFVLTAVRSVRIHPMNYFFIGTAFFAFHLLNAYLVDHISIHLSFLICSVVSIFLLISYMRLVVGLKFALLEVGISQFVFLVVFSYTFFFEGYTGLAITILSIITLFVVMQFTGRIDWESIFKSNGKEPPKVVGKAN